MFVYIEAEKMMITGLDRYIGIDVWILFLTISCPKATQSQFYFGSQNVSNWEYNDFRKFIYIVMAKR